MGTTAEPGGAACSGLRAGVTLATGAVTCNDGLDRRQVVGDDGGALRPLEEVREVGRQLGPAARGLLDRVRELARVGGRQRDGGHARLPSGPRRADPDRGVRVHQQSGLGVHGAHDAQRVGVVEPRALNTGASHSSYWSASTAR